MSCLVYSHDVDITDWLYSHGIFNSFIHKSICTLIKFMESSHIEYTLSIDDSVKIVAGIPLVTTFHISGDRVVCTTLGALTSSVDSWDFLKGDISEKQLLEDSGLTSSVFAADAKQDYN